MAAHSAGHPVIVAGDFNLHLEDEPDATIYQRLVDEAGLTDVCDFLSCPGPLQIEKALFRSTAGVTLEPLSDHPALAVRFRWSFGPGT